MVTSSAMPGFGNSNCRPQARSRTSRRHVRISRSRTRHSSADMKKKPPLSGCPRKGQRATLGRWWHLCPCRQPRTKSNQTKYRTTCSALHLVNNQRFCAESQVLQAVLQIPSKQSLPTLPLGQFFFTANPISVSGSWIWPYIWWSQKGSLGQEKGFWGASLVTKLLVQHHHEWWQLVSNTHY